MLKNTYILFTLLTVLLPVGFLFADTNFKSDAQEIYQEFLSPFCPGRSLADCPSKRATELKVDIKERLENGESKELIMSSLMQEYGEHLNSKPATSGFALLAWAVPIVFVLMACVLVFRWIRKMQD